MNRNEIIAKVKELGLATNKPAHMCSTDYLKSVLDANVEVKVVQKATMKEMILELAKEEGATRKQIQDKLINAGFATARYAYVVHILKLCGVEVTKSSRKKVEVA